MIFQYCGSISTQKQKDLSFLSMQIFEPQTPGTQKNMLANSAMIDPGIKNYFTDHKWSLLWSWRHFYDF
jgi:hypothetical protein